jgi:hypothetical protein
MVYYAPLRWLGLLSIQERLPNAIESAQPPHTPEEKKRPAMCYTTQLIHSCGHNGSLSFTCPKILTSKECPSRYIRQVANVKRCRLCQLGRQIRRVEEIVELQDIDDLSRLIETKI